MLVYLSAPADVLWERIFNDAHRHKTRVKMNPSTGLHDVREALSHREPIYTAAADRVVEVADQTIESIVDGIMTRCNLRDELKDT
jgi:shikimate kinase